MDFYEIFFTFLILSLTQFVGMYIGNLTLYEKEESKKYLAGIKHFVLSITLFFVFFQLTKSWYSLIVFVVALAFFVVTQNKDSIKFDTFELGTLFVTLLFIFLLQIQYLSLVLLVLYIMINATAIIHKINMDYKNKKIIHKKILVLKTEYIGFFFITGIFAIILILLK